jgi:hypothetical protein
MGQFPIQQWWDRLDPGTQEWLLRNPGCVVLPRTLANAIQQAVGDMEQNRHGEVQLTPADQDFLRARARTAG